MAIDFTKLLQDAGPGLFKGAVGAGVGALNVNEANRRAKQAQAAGQPFGAAALAQLNQAQGFDTAANAKQRFEQEQALLAPEQEVQRQALMRELQKKGMLGVGTNAPAAGVAAGTQHNPMLTSLLAAQEQARLRSAQGSLDASQNTLNQQVNRASALQGTAGTASQQTRQNQPSASFANVLTGILGNKDVQSGLFSAGKGLFSGLFGGGDGGGLFSNQRFDQPDFSAGYY